MIFSKPVKGETKPKNGEPPIKFCRIMISTKNDDGSVGELIFPTTELFSFGVSVNTSQETGNATGYSLPLCLWNKDNPTAQEKAFSSKLEEVVEECKNHLLLDQTKEDIEKYELERAELKKLNSFIYWKKDKGKVVEGTGPTLYPKLIESKKSNKILTAFFDSDGNEIDALSLIGRFCWCKAAVKIESIFIGAKISLQVKVYESEVRLIDSGVKRLLRRPQADKTVTSKPVTNHQQDEGEESGGEEIVDTPVARMIRPATPPPPPEQEAIPPPPRKVVKKLVKKAP